MKEPAAASASAATRAAVFAALAAIVAAVCGCGGKAPPKPTPMEPLSRQPTGTTEREDWEVVRLDGARIGYNHTTVSRETIRGQPYRRIDGESRLTLSRQGTSIQANVYFSVVQTPAGELVECAHSIEQDTSTIQRFEARVEGSRLRTRLIVGGNEQDSSVPWEKSYGGYTAVYDSLRAAPMKPGEKRTLRALDAEANAVTAHHLEAKQRETVELLDGRRELLRIDLRREFASQRNPTPGVLWTDDEGEVWKFSPGAGLESFRVDKLVALEKSQPVEVDLMESVKVPLAKPLPRPQQTKRIRYRVRLSEGDPASAFVSGPSQQVVPVDAHTADVTVYALRGGDPWGNAKAPADPPTDGDRKPNLWVQSDAPEIVAAAKQGGGDATDPWQVAVALERFTKSRMTNTNYARAFDSALVALRSGSGDCSEHAVLLAALVRARGIPARCAFGLVYLDGALLYHMWVEVYAGGRWIGVDAMFPRGGLSAAYLKLGHTNLSGPGALADLLPAAQVARRLAVEVAEVEYW